MFRNKWSAKKAHDRERKKCAEHKNIAMRKINQLDNAVHHRIAERDEGDNSPICEPGKHLLKQK
jgi:hypothetical protein